MDRNPNSHRGYWMLVVSAAAILTITMGIRQSLGLFIAPLNEATGLGIVSISLAMAVGQFVWGAVQPLFGMVSDRFGPQRIIALGGLLLALGIALTPLVRSDWAMILTIGVMTAAGAGAGSFSILIGATARHLPAERRAFAAGFINAGGSLGQFLFAPLNQAIITSFGWVTAMLTTAGLALLTLPLGFILGLRRESSNTPAIQSTPAIALVDQLAQAMRNKSYWCLHAGFFTCGFHIAFLVTHLPGAVNLCSLTGNVAANSLAIIGLANILGSLCVGALGARIRLKYLLFWTYFIRAAAIALYLFAPKTPLTFYVFAAVLGFTWLSTVPPTAGLVGKLFGIRHLGTLFGLTLLTHQIGGFFGAWLGGVALQHLGNYDCMWWGDIALAMTAALINLPIEEDRVMRVRTA